MSRHATKKMCRGRNIEHELEFKDIIVRGAGISRKIAKLRAGGGD